MPPEVPRYDSNFAFPAGPLLPKSKSGSGSEPPPDPKGKMKGGQGGRRLGSTTQRQGGAYNPRNPYGTGLDRTDTSFKKTGKQKKNVSGSGM